MSGFLTSGVPNIVIANGAERLPIDTGNLAGENPESGSIRMLQLATMLAKLQNTVSATPTASTRYFITFQIQVETQLTGIEFYIGGTGGTDHVIAELYAPLAPGATTVLPVASTDPVTPSGIGTVVGTANTWQQLTFKDTSGNALPYLAQPGLYYISLCFGGNTCRYEAYEAPAIPALTLAFQTINNVANVPVVTGVLSNGSAAQTFGTVAAITPPSTYTAGSGPVAQVY